ncbi:phosphopantetheine-binding protein [Streptomyces sp. rh34]|uniref:phosphopantetheine-binding protein n=1 Tax=Streptomyces sp. rh34 TaxID=2034272 RepID=UPI0015CF08DC|nr:phosphopantetheine-binding protein [Streptomyces sp. rh34]
MPAHLMPSAIVVLDRMPMTTKGKVNDTALPCPPSSRPEPSRSYTAPDSAAERRAARVWQQQPTLNRVGVHDNFFDSGGNSIRLSAVLAALRKHPEYQDLITLTDLFRHPTAAAVAARLDRTAEQEAARRGGDRRAAPHKLRSRKGTTR